MHNILYMGSMMTRCLVSLLRQGGQLHHHLVLVLLRLQVLVMHHGLQPVVPVADSVIGAAGQPLCNLVPRGGRQAGR